MNNIAKIGEKAPHLQLAKWVKGTPVTLDQLLGHVVLVEVVQVNCPGCFLYGLPKAIELHRQYEKEGLFIMGMATAFEDFDKNNLENLQLLVNQNTVVGETRKYLNANNQLLDGKLSYQIPFPVAMDQITQQQQDISVEETLLLIKQHIPDFSDRTEAEQHKIQQQALLYLQNRLNKAETFSMYALQGTPAHIVIDKKGILRATEFGHFEELEWLINTLLKE